MVGHWSPSPDNVAFAHDNHTLSRCGFHPSPLVWCADRYDYQEIIWFLPVTVSIFCCLFCYALLDLLPVGRLAGQYLRTSDLKWLQDVYRCVNELSSPSKKTKSRWRRLSTTSGFCIDMALLVMTFVSMILSGSEVELVPNDWNLGQVIAVAIWAPPILKYFYWSLCEYRSRHILCSRLTDLVGVESYSAARLPSPYKITKTDSDQSGWNAIQSPKKRTVTIERCILYGLVAQLRPPAFLEEFSQFTSVSPI